MISDTTSSVERPKRCAIMPEIVYSPELYNFFALPSVREEFCNAGLAKSQEVLAVPLAAFPEYAIGSLGHLDNIFLRFYDAFLQYERDLADWNLRYGPKPEPVMFAPGPVTTPPPTTPVSG